MSPQLSSVPAALAVPLSPPVRPAFAAHAVDIVLLSPHGRQLAVLLERWEAKDGSHSSGWMLPRESPWPTDATLEESALRAAARALPEGTTPTWLAQTGARIAARDDRAEMSAELTIGVVATVAEGVADVGPASGAAVAWFADWPALPLVERQRSVLHAALQTLRLHLDTSPVAFRLLPATFTLSDLQRVYEILLGHRLHKASFRRALQAAALVEPTDAWRSEGRGRPAQLFRYAPRRRRTRRRGVRFDLLRI